MLRALAAFLIIAALGWPLERLTHRSQAEPIGSFTAVSEEKPVIAVISFTQLPTQISIWHLGQQKWSAQPKDLEIQTELKLPWPKEGVDLRIVVAWPEGASLAGAQLRVTDPEGTEHIGSIFSKGPADEILTFR